MPNILDIGCGEGHELKYFSNIGYDVYGVDFSLYGLQAHNPDMIPYVIQGNLFDVMESLSEKKILFDFIIADNVLEHISDEKLFFNKIKHIIHDDSLIFIRVPNDFSIFQIEIFKKNLIHTNYWVTADSGEHNYYFTLQSLIELGSEMGFTTLDYYSDFPIDFFLANESSNFIEHQEAGKNAHKARLLIENMLYAQSMERAHVLHQAYAQAGVGRNVTIVFKSA